MIINENWPGAHPEMVAAFTELMGAVGAIPTHKEVTFEPEAREIVTYAAMDYSLEGIAQELSVLAGEEVPIKEVRSRLQPAYEEVHGQHGGNSQQKLPHLTYVMLNNRSVPYPDLSRFRPTLTAEESIVLLGFASRQWVKAIGQIAGLSPRYRLDRVINDTHEKFGTETNHGLVGRAFMFGFFGPSIKLPAGRQR